MSHIEGLPSIVGLKKDTVTVNSDLDFTSGELKVVTVTKGANIEIISATVSNSDATNVATRLIGIDGNVLKFELSAVNGTPQNVDYTYTIRYIERS